MIHSAKVRLWVLMRQMTSTPGLSSNSSAAAGVISAQMICPMSIATKTASSHVEHILAKLGASRRAEIGSWVATTVRATASAGRSDEPTPGRLGMPPVETALSIRH